MPGGLANHYYYQMSSAPDQHHLRILSIEDEPIVSRRLQRLTGEILGDRLGAFSAVEGLDTAFDVLDAGGTDILLLDLNLAGRDGFELLGRFASYASQTIVVSAYAERAVEAFEYGVVDFVPKPFSKDRLATALDRAIRTQPSPAMQKLQYLTFRAGRRTDVVPLRDVVLIKGADKYSEVLLRDGSQRLHDKKLADFEMLLPEDYVRVHKSYLVPTVRVKRIESSPGSKYEALLDTGEVIPVGRTRVAELRARLGI